MYLELQEKTALVTGGSRGLGLDTAKNLVAAGAKVIITGRDELKLKYETESLNKDCNKASYFQVDFESPSSVSELIMFCQRENLEPDILINGLGGGFGSTNWDKTEIYEKIMRLNFMVAQELTAWAAPRMIKKGWGRIIYFGTLSVNKKSPPAAYVAAKSALTTYMKVISKDIAFQCPNVVLGMVSPGAISVPGKYFNKIETENPELLKEKLSEIQVPANRLGSVAEVTNVVLFLCSNLASYMHGTNIEIDGGASN